MAQTVIGMFESSSKAQEAIQELVESGITRDRIDLSGGNTSGSSYSSTSSTDTSEHHESGISKFFKSLFGDDDNDDADKYTRVASRTQSIVTVHAETRDEAERAADILDDNGAVDVDEHAAQMGYSTTGNYSGTGTGSTAAAATGVTGVGATTGVTGLEDTGTTDYTDRTGLGNTGTDYNRSGVGNTAGTDYTDTTTVGGTDTGRTDLSGTADTDYTNTNRTGLRTTGDTDYTDSDLRNTTSDDETRKIPIIEENLEVGKREVRTGGVRLRSRIIERPVEESLRLREERVNVERNPVDRPATDADLSNFQERNIEMVERAEVPVVNKEARVVEEVSIAKDVEERTETVKDTVRKTEVDVENLEKDDLKDIRTNKNNL